MIYGSVCSGIEAASVAWAPLGWRPAWFAEIDPFASAALAHHYPEVRNFGDFTTITADAAGTIDLLVGGTPCQAFSVAGQRLGLDDPRGNLTLAFLRLAARLRPRWLVWENVPGVLSIDAGRTFGTVLRAMAELGYGIAYRVLDAQFFGVPQRRRRVFVVGHLGNWQAAAAVLFERESLRRNPAARRKTQKVVAALTAAGVGTCGADDNQAQSGHLIAFGGGNTSGAIDVATALTHHGVRQDFDTETFCVEVAPPLLAGDNRTGGERSPGMSADSAESLIAHTLLGKPNCSRDGWTYVAHTLRGEGMDASEDGTGRGTPIIPVLAGTPKANNGGGGFGSDPSETFVPVVASTLTAKDGSGSRLEPAQTFIPVAFSSKDHGADAMEDVAPTLRAMGHSQSHPNAGGQIAVVTPAPVVFERRFARNGRGAPDVLCPPLKAQSGTTGNKQRCLSPLLWRWRHRSRTPFR